jgi:uncharacterized membrane protein SirB2
MVELKIFHITCVVVSISGFFLRGLILFLKPELLQPRWIRIVPHIIDSLLFFSGIGLAVGMHYLPWLHHWLLAKMAALLVYIALGHVVLGRRHEFSTAVRFVCWLLALAAASYMVYVARTRQVAFW